MTFLGFALAASGCGLFLGANLQWWSVKCWLAERGFAVSIWRHDLDLRILAQQSALPEDEIRPQKRRMRHCFLIAGLGGALFFLGMAIIASELG